MTLRYGSPEAITSAMSRVCSPTYPSRGCLVAGCELGLTSAVACRRARSAATRFDAIDSSRTRALGDGDAAAVDATAVGRLGNLCGVRGFGLFQSCRLFCRWHGRAFGRRKFAWVIHHQNRWMPGGGEVGQDAPQSPSTWSVKYPYMCGGLTNHQLSVEDPPAVIGSPLARPLFLMRKVVWFGMPWGAPVEVRFHRDRRRSARAGASVRLFRLARDGCR